VIVSRSSYSYSANVNLELFRDRRRASWQELDVLVRRSRRKLGPDEVLRLGALYRGAAADLALARRAFPAESVVPELEQLVTRSHSAVYAAPTRRASVIRFFKRDYWRLVAERPAALLAAFVLLFAPAALSGGWALSSPAAAAGLVAANTRSARRSRPAADCCAAAAS